MERYIITHNVFKWDQLFNLNKTKRDLFLSMNCNPPIAVDYALPQQWLNEFVKKTGLDYDQVRFSTFYAYPETSTFGLPISGCYEVNKQLDAKHFNRQVKTILVQDRFSISKDNELKQLKRFLRVREEMLCLQDELMAWFGLDTIDQLNEALIEKVKGD